MKYENIKVGDKVVPFKKTYKFYAVPFAEYCNCGSLHADNFIKKGYMTVKEKYKDYCSLDGDYFAYEDFNLLFPVINKQYTMEF